MGEQTPPASAQALRQKILQQRLRSRMQAHRATMAPAGIPVADRSRPVPLSPPQQRLWLLDQLGPASAAYCLPTALQLRGALDKVALRAALNRLVARHESLRTHFPCVQGVPAQAFSADDAGLPLIDVDLRGLRDGERRRELERLVAQEAQAPFDLEQGPLIRGQLLQLADDDHVLLITQHHIITDAWSLRLMIGEVASLYATFHSCARDSTPLPAVQYADFAAWQRQWLQGPVLEHQLAFWRQHLEGAPALLELPADRPRPPLQRHAGASIALVLPERLTKALKALAQAQGCTVFMVLLAGWSVLLARLSGQQEVVIGTPVANRQRPETERILGFFVNTLALRVDLSANPSVNALLAQVKASALAAFAHQELPFEQVVEALQPQRSLSYSPVFQAMLSLDDAPDTSAAALPGLSMEPLAPPRTSSHFDLSLALGEKNGVLSGAITYSTDLFDASTVERWSVHLCTLLQDMVEHPGTHIGSLSLLSAGQRQEVVEGFNATAVDDSQDALIHELFQQRAAEIPECEAVRMGDQYLSYGDLNARSNQLAHDLLERGVVPDQRVAICVERGVDLAVGILGILKAGAAYVPLDPDYPTSRQAYMLQDSQPVALVTQAGLVARLPPSTVPLVVLDWQATGTGLAAQPAHDPLLRRSGLGPRNLAYVIYTSGSTGQPKGVMVEHRSAVNFWRVMTRTTHARCLPGSRIGLNAAFSFDMSLKGILQLLSGHCLMPIPQSIRASGYELVQFLEDNRIDALDTTPSQLEGLLEAGLLEPGRHRPCSVLVGGEPIRAALWERLRASQQVQFHNMYGPTEATIDATIIGIEVAGSTPTLGGPIDNVRIYLLDTLGNPVPIGVAGEIYIAGAGVARGYLDRPALTAERFLADPFSGQKGERMYRTGDLARWRPDGTLVFLGRNDSQVKIRGFRVELGEIEAQLGACPGIREAVVVARDDAPDTVRLVAYVVADPQPVAAELRDALHRQLPEHMIPSAFVHLPSLPLTPNGKLDRQALPLPDADALVSRAFEPPIGPVEQTLATLWSALLGPERIGRNDNFFELGGHSLMVVTLVTRLREAGLHLPAQAVFATPVLHVLASAVTDVGTEGVSSAVSPILPQVVRITPAQLPLVTLGQNDIDLIAVSVPGGTANIQEVYPLLPLQEGLLFHHLLEEEGDTYLSRDLLAFDSRALLDGFLDALNIVIARHDILRSALRWEGISTPVQVVHRHAPLQMKVLFPASDGCARSALERASDPRRLRLDLRNAPVLAAYGVEDRAKGEWLLALVRHHVVCDHVTLDLALEEVAMVLRGQEKRLGAPRPFREIVVQARQVSVEEHEAYFRQELHDIQTPTAPFGVADMLPGGRALIESVEHLEPQLVQRIRACARREGIAPAVLFHVAWAQVLARYTGNDDVVFGTVLSGRLQGVAGAEQILGMTINTLPLRISLGARSVRQLLLETSQRMRGLLAHEHAPLLLAQRCSGVERSQPLFSTLLNFRHSQARILAADTASRALQDGIRSLAVEGDHTSYPLSIRIDDTADTFALTTEWWDGLDGRRIGASLPVALSSLVDALDSAPGTPQFQLEVLGASERQRLLQGFNATDRPYSTHDSIHSLFEAQVAARPQAVALVEGTQVLRYGELNAQANRLAHYLIGQGVRPDDRVGVCLERGIALVVALLGILKAGGAYVPLDPGYPPDRLGYMLADSAPRCVLTQAAVQTVLPASVPVIALDQAGLLDGQPVHDPDPQALGLTPQHLAYVIYTSGSTGRPKGVMNQHDGVVNRLLWAQEQFALDASDRVLQKTPFGFDVSVWEFFLPLLAGAQLVLARPGGHQDPHYLAGLMASAGITVLHFVPSMLQVFLDEADTSGCGGVRQILCSGEALPAALQNRLLERLPQVALYNLYGPTEAAVDVTCWRCQPGSATVPIGRPIANTQIHIVDRYLQPVPIGVAGELLIGGVQVARGYLNQPQLTAERFIEDPFHPGGRVYRSGDLARWRQDGTIDYLGRNDDQVKLRGQRIELGEVQSQLQQLPHVRDAVVVAREDRAGDPRLVAYVVTVPGVELTVSTVREALARTLTEVMLPSAVVSLPALPLTPNGKLDRQALPVPGMESLAARAYEPPREGMEQALAQLWCELLDVARVGRADHFFDLGGNSLIAIQLVSRIRMAFEVDLALATVFRHPHLADLSEQVLLAMLASCSSDEVAAMELDLGDGERSDRHG